MVMRWLFLSILSCFFFSSFSQKVAAVINAEKAFARYALEHNTKEAFLKFSDDSALVFNKGKANNAKKVWTSNPVSATKLLWQPAFAGISRSGELGFTTGPWEAKKSVNDTALARGEYTTVWHKNAAGEWTFLLDMGITYKGLSYQPDKIIKAKKGTKKSDASNAVMIDENFIAAYTEKGNAAFVNFINPDAWFNLQGSAPLKSRAEILENLNLIPEGIKFTPISGGLSRSKDWAYVYGTMKSGETEENYLRIWQHFTEGWKLVVQVLKL